MQLNFNPFPIINTSRLVLRNFIDEDKQPMFLLRSDADVMKYVPRPLAKTIEDVEPLINMIEDLLQKNEAINWIIALKDTNEMIGYIGMYRLQKENFRTEVGYMILPKFQRNGFADEALKAVVHYGFTKLKFNSIFAVIDPENAASRKVLAKNNFIKEGYFHQDFHFENKFYDSEFWSILKSAFFISI